MTNGQFKNLDKEESVKILIESGADVNIQDDTGYTPLHWATKEGYENIVKILIENGA